MHAFVWRYHLPVTADLKSHLGKLQWVITKRAATADFTRMTQTPVIYRTTCCRRHKWDQVKYQHVTIVFMWQNVWQNRWAAAQCRNVLTDSLQYWLVFGRQVAVPQIKLRKLQQLGRCQLLHPHFITCPCSNPKQKPGPFPNKYSVSTWFLVSSQCRGTKIHHFYPKCSIICEVPPPKHRPGLERWWPHSWNLQRRPARCTCVGTYGGQYVYTGGKRVYIYIYMYIHIHTYTHTRHIHIWYRR